MTKLYILREIKRTTQANGGKPLRKIQFESDTGIKRYDWFGVYWARWSDALREAGYLPQHYVQATSCVAWMPSEVLCGSERDMS